MHYDFNKDIELGNEGEKVVLNDLISMGAEVVIGSNDNNAYDFAISHKGKILYYECKTDFYKDTGNLFVEVKCRGKESGLNVTKADWFATYFKSTNEIWYIKVDELRELVARFPHRKTENSGDKGSGTEGYLINKAIFSNYFIIRKV
jgi:hypothetical protein